MQVQRFRKRGLWCLATTGALVAALGATSPAQGEPDVTPDSMPPPVEADGQLPTANPDDPLASKTPTAYDLTSPEVLIPRLVEVFGDRYVHLSLEENEAVYAVWVLDLQVAEDGALLLKVDSEAPIVLKSASVPRRALDELKETFVSSSPHGRMGIDSFGASYSTGSLDIGYTTSTTPMELARALSSRLMDTPIVDQFGNHLAGPVAAPAKAVVKLEPSAMEEQEGAGEAPYRAGKYLAVGSMEDNCTTGFLFTRNDKRFGSTAGHCGRGNDLVFFAGDLKGELVSNLLYDGQGTQANPSPGDAVFYDLGNGGTATVFYNPTTNLDVVGRVPTSDLIEGLRLCTYGAFSDNTPATCGPLFEPLDQTKWSNTADRWVGNAYCWENDPGETVGGDSGAPAVRLLGGGDVRAAGLHRLKGSGTAGSYGCFTAIQPVLNSSNMSLITK
jgi:hypothetical protein